MTLNTNIDPYYDDFDPAKNFMQILARPGIPVQARELSQIQSFLSHQLASHASHIFKDGSNVTNAAVSITFNQDYIDVNETVDVTLIDRIFEITANSATFKVTGVDVTLNRLFILPFSGDLITGAADIDTVQDGASPTSVPITINDIGRTIRANSDPGIVFANGKFIQTSSQEYIIPNGDNVSEYNVGFQLQELFITEAEDASLLDPASGSTNANAPGAHRLNTELVLTSYEFGETVPDDFYTFVTIQNGVVTKTHNDVQYADIVDILASRTYDESGDYTVGNFPISLEDNPLDSSKLDVILQPGTAVVQGYSTETISPTTLTLDKPRETKLANNVNLFSSYGIFFLVDSITGNFDVSSKETVQLFSGSGGTGNEIGATNEIRIVGIHNISPSIRVYVSGVSDLQPLLGSVKSIVSGTNIIDIETQEIEEDGLVGVVEEALYGITPNPAPIFTLNNKNVEGVVLNETIYSSQKSFIGFTNKVGNDFVITADDNQTDFDVGSPLIIVTENGTGTDLSGIAIPSVNNVNGGTSTINISGLAAYSSIDVLVKTDETQANPKTKVLTETSISFTASGTEELLSHYDIFEIVSVTKDSVPVAVSSIGLDNGQTDFYYNFGKLTNLTDTSLYDVTYRYFNHTGTGDYFSINSYMISGNLSLDPDLYSKLPKYKSISGLVEYDLKDALDFRRSETDLASGTDLPTPESSIFVDYNYYTPRTDKVYVTKDGNFGITKGIPSDIPDEPNDLANALTLYTLSMPGFVADPEDVDVQLLDNNRYTMRQIGELEKRIEDLEYYASLSILESKTAGLTIVDGEGNNKFKNGLLVDSFQDHSIGDVFDEEYNVSIDETENELRPSFALDNIDLISQQEFYDGPTFTIPEIKANQNTYTLDYTTKEMINQDKASESINVNPYNVFTWFGNVEMDPPSDNWLDTETKPAVTISVDANVDAFRNISNFMGTRWGSWQTNWSTSRSRSSTSSNRNSFIDRSNWRRGPHGTWLSRVDQTRTTRTTTTTTTTGQSRNGRFLNVGSKWQNRDLGDRVIDTRIIPFMREKTVTFKATGLKPSTNLKAFFDETEVTANTEGILPATGVGVLTTDAAGKIEGTFTVPAGTFRTGTRKFALIDDEVTPGTQAFVNFTAQGLIQTREQQILSVEQPTVSLDIATEQRVLTSTSSRSNSSVSQSRSRPFDPIAQSFFVDSEGGVFIDSVDIFFKTKDDNIPVSLEIVTNLNGYPSTTTLPFAKTVLDAADVNISETGTLSTRFTFSDPIYLEHLGDYSIVLKSNSNQYEAFVAKIGGTDVQSGKLIAEQPYIGSFFKSQNAFTWNADQERDMKFVINQCVFSLNQGLLHMQVKDDYTSQDFTALMPNIEDLLVDGTTANYYYQVAAAGTQDLTTSGYEELFNRTNTELFSQDEFTTTTEPLRFLAQLQTTNDAVSPVIHRHRASIITINNFSEVDSGSDLYAGSYLTRTTTLASEANDLKVIFDASKESGADVNVYYKTGELVPNFVEHKDTQEPILDFEGRRVYVYHISDTDVASIKSTAVVTTIDQTNDRIFLKQISDVSAFINEADFGTNSLDTDFGVIITTDNSLDSQTILDWDSVTTYNRVTDNNGPAFAIFNNKIYKSQVSNNLNQTPGTGYAWVEVESNLLVTTLQDNVKQTWQTMILEEVVDQSVNTENFIEYSYQPENAIREDFTQYSIKIEFRVTDPARVTKVKDLRVIALS